MVGSGVFEFCMGNGSFLLSENWMVSLGCR